MAFEINQTHCPVCSRKLSKPIEHAPKLTEDYGLVCCRVCGDFVLHDSAYSFLSTLDIPANKRSADYSHAIRKQTLAQDNAEAPIITRDLIDYWWNNASLPSPFEQADNLILYLGDNQSEPGKGLEVISSSVLGIIGVASNEGLGFVFESLKHDGYVVGSLTYIPAFVLSNDTSSLTADQKALSGELSLTFKGWGRYDKLKKGVASGSTAFMAMQFGDDVLEHMVDTCFRGAVASTGFELRKINDPQSQRAGLIDDRLRMEIKAARFMLCDLTHNNNGAYWEAGYAEGLGKPVIYTCEQSVFGKRLKEGAGTHFDTNHHLHILWDKDNPQKAAENLIACIRTTIPEAKQSELLTAL